MTSSIPLKIEFVDLSRPGQKPTVRSSQRANSHAAREAIARARRLRVQEYQASQAKRQCIEHDDAKIRNKTRSEWKLSSLNNEQSFPYPEESSKMLIPNPATLLPADRKDPFASFAAPLNPMEHFLLDHYVKAVLPYLTTHCTIIGHQSIRHTDMVGEWVPLALTDAGLLSGIFLAACRHLCLYSHSNAHVAEMAVNYKLICLRELGNAITTFSARSKNRDTAVAKAMTLALDEIMIHDLAASRKHVRATVTMVEMTGGPQMLGLNGLLSRILHRFIHEKRLLDDVPVVPCSQAFTGMKII